MPDLLTLSFYFQKVDTIHYIPQHRTTWDYAARYYDGMSRAAAS